MAAIMEQLCWCATWCEMMWMDRGSEWINWEATWRCKTILKHPLAGNTAFLQSVQCWNVLNVSLALSMSREALTKPSIQVFAEQETVDGFDPPGSFNRQAVHATDRFDAKKEPVLWYLWLLIIVYYCWTLLDAFDALDAFERFWMSLRSWPHFFSPLSMAFGTSQHQRLRRWLAQAYFHN